MRPHDLQPTRLPLPGILQARTLEWVAISFSNARKGKGKVKSLSHVRLLATPWTAATFRDEIFPQDYLYDKQLGKFLTEAQCTAQYFRL